MARKFLTPIDLSKNELQNAVVQNLASAPSSPVKGQLYFNSTGGDNTLYWYDGAGWVPAKATGGAFPGYGAVPAETTFGIARADGAATTVARSDHTHGSPTHDAAAHSAIPISALAVPTVDVSWNSKKITNLADPTISTDAANKQYVDNLVAGLSWKETARIASLTNVTISGLAAIDGVTPVANDRILLMGQSTGSQNGLWLAQSGAWSRPTDYNAAGEAEAAAMFVLEGTANGDKAFVCTTNAPITIDTTATTWVQIGAGTGYVAGAGLLATGNTFDVVAGDSTLTVSADFIIVNTATIASVAFSNSNYAPLTRTITAGAGLIGGGDLNANRTLDIAALNGSIVVAADSIAVGYGGTGAAVTAARSDHTHDTGASSSYVKQFGQNCSAGTTTVVNHAFNNQDAVAKVFRNSTPFDEVECDVEHTDVNNTTVRFATAVAAGDYRIVVTGRQL